MRTDAELAQDRARVARYDAIHRALLTGLLGHVGLKTDLHEYTGVRDRKFHIFPGSSLFQKKPQWVMAAEMVETTRLYARTVASIKPEWIEKLGAHLTSRTYTEPRWSRTTGHVVAFEKVTLQGLTLVPRRSVNFGTIDAKKSRELFIHHALVLGEYETDAPWFRHNRNLLREIEMIEAKLRRHNVLVDLKTRFSFYDARVPAAVVSGPTFEKWRSVAERNNRRVLFMDRRDLMLHDASAASKEQFPETITVNGIALKLSYHFDPGHPADGVTATVPLTSLNQLPAEPFEWGVPGWLKEKTVALIKTLPKTLRVCFVPAPDFADRAVAAIRFGEGDLLHSLAWQLGRLTGVQVPREALQLAELEPWLRMNFQIVDEAGKPILAGRDLNEIRRKLRIELKAAFANLPSSEFNRDGLTEWNFGDLPDRVELDRGGMKLIGYPALVDNGPNVSLRLLDTPEAARITSRGGVRRLFIIEYSPTIQYELQDLRQLQQMCLHYAPLGSCRELKAGLTTVMADRIFFGDALDVRTQMDFELRLESSWNKMRPVAREVSEVVEPILASYHTLSTQFSQDYAPLLLPSIREMRQHFAHLMTKDFLTRTPYAWLVHMPRYLKGIELRLTKLRNAGLARDASASIAIAPFWQRYLDRLEKHRLDNTRDVELSQFRWMLEEFRVSLFAQELKTAIPVSPQRLEKQWSLVKP